MMLKHDNQFGYYMYDAGGERTYKLTGNIVQYNVNGQPHYYAQPTMATLYVSPYLVGTSQGYTKHYYAGSERVASKLGGGGITGIGTPVTDITYKRDSWQTPYANLWNNCLNLAPPCSNYLYHSSMNHPETTPETALYFYHPDHLGSAAWVTDSSGGAIQHLQYLPFGETHLDQRSTGWSTRYSFSAKEKDEESGYSYFGARYYDSELSIWLSVDPMSDKYPSLTPYNYCAGNPMILVDPNGEDIWTIQEDGTINRQTDKKIDRIDVIDKDGNTIKGTESKYGTIKQHTTTINVSGKDTKIDYFDIKGDDLAKETFENIANNTNIEWGHAKIGTKNSDQNIIGTSHEASSTSILGFLFATNYTLKEVTHNHPSGLPFPSKADMDAGENFQAQFPNIKQNIYINNGKYGHKSGYYGYDKFGSTWGVTVMPK
jgi:RHS repeat-associated protein